jgi:hypothetical protein
VLKLVIAERIPFDKEAIWEDKNVGEIIELIREVAVRVKNEARFAADRVIAPIIGFT